MYDRWIGDKSNTDGYTKFQAQLKQCEQWNNRWLCLFELSWLVVHQFFQELCTVTVHRGPRWKTKQKKKKKMCKSSALKFIRTVIKA